MEIPFVDDLIERLYRFLGKTGLALATAGLLTYWRTGKLSISVWMFAIGMSLSLTFGRWARRMAKAEADLYASPAPEADDASHRTRRALRFWTHKRRREPQL